MATLKDAAMAYEAKHTKNIADLPEVSTDLQIYEATAIDKDANEFTYKYVEFNGEQYRVPEVVLRDIKTILEANPAIKKFVVKKSGQGLGTRYTVIPK